MNRAIASLLVLAFFSACPGPHVVSRFRVGGTVIGIEGSGLVLQLNGTEDLPVRITGEFTFDVPLEDGQPYVVTVKTHPTSPAQLCTVARGTGSLSGRNVVDVEVSCATQSFAVGGSVSGLTGTGLVLRNNGGDDLTISANGPFRFLTPVKSGAAYSVAVATQPTQPTQTCTIQSGFGVMGAGEVLDLAVTCMTNPVTIGGRVVGLLGTGLVLQNNGGSDLTVAAGASSFSFTVPRDAGYAISVKAQPTNPSQVCTVTNAGGTTTTVDVSNIDVTCLTTLFTVGGTVTGLAGAGLVLHNSDGTDVPVAAGATSYQFQVPSGGAYALTVKTQPSSPTQTCTLVNASGTVTGMNVTDAHLTCVSTTFTVGGTIMGLLGSGLVLQNNGGNDLTLSAGTTSYSFTVASGSVYAVSIRTQPSSPIQVCAVSNAGGTVGNGNVVNVSINCSTTSFTVGGTITGLLGAGLTLQNNGGSNLTIAAGATQYSFTVPSGGSYAVTVLSQPVSPTQVCTLVNASGSVTGNVTNAHLTCVTSSFTVSGTITGLAGSGLVLQNNGGNNLTLPAGSTTYGFTVPSSGPYAVSVLTQPSTPTQSCVVSNASGTVTTGNVTNVNINCTTTSFTVGGTITGLSGSGLVLQNNLGGDLPASGTGYVFTVPSNTGYSVSVRTQPTTPTQVCTVVNASGTVTNVNVTNVNVTCVSTPFNLGGTITGLVGSGLVLQNNLGADLPASGASWSVSALSGSGYSVTVKTQPTNPTQVCTVANPTGTVPNGDVTNINLTCTCSPYCPQVLLLAGTKSLTAGHIAARYAPGGTWAITRLSGTTQSGTGLAILDDGTGVGLLENNGDDLLKYTRWTGSWSSLANVAASVTTRSKPSLGSGASAVAVFQGIDFKHYTTTFSGTWSVVGQVGVPRVAQVFGPSAPVMLERAPGTFTIAYIDGSAGNLNGVSAIDFSATLWQFPAIVGLEVTDYFKEPSIVAPTSGPSTMVTWLTSTQFRFSTQTGASWSAAANVTNATSVDPASLLALAAGEVLLAFRGLDGKLYAMSYSSGSWGMPSLPLAGGATILGSPVLAKGQGGALAELAYVGTDNAAYHLRLAANRTWSAPVQVGTSVDFVSIVSGP